MRNGRFVILYGEWRIGKVKRCGSVRERKDGKVFLLKKGCSWGAALPVDIFWGRGRVRL